MYFTAEVARDIVHLLSRADSLESGGTIIDCAFSENLSPSPSVAFSSSLTAPGASRRHVTF